MKKCVFLFVLAAFTFSFMSCVKTFTCVCTTVDSSGALPEATVLEEQITGSRKVAESLCDGGDAVTGAFVTTCELK